MARDLALTTILQRKGRSLDAMADSIAALQRRATGDAQALLDRWRGINTEIARLVLNTQRNITLAEAQVVKEMEEQKEKLEISISAHSAEFRTQIIPRTYARNEKA